MMRCTMGLLLGLSCSQLLAAEPSQTGKNITLQADKIARQTQRLELQKARDAAAGNAAREQRILATSQAAGWEHLETQKARQQFAERHQREAPYLQEAKDAAAKTRKMDAPKMKIIKHKQHQP
ncbi:hypothetical protein [Shewanella sp. YIC-542]|uniref:hypothetical protein n=1 Tax=Shewanella mytili TaxID=3377111 RepID=UPI00398F0EC9